MAGNKRWTTDELELLSKHYETSHIDEMMELLPNRSKTAIQWQANKLGLVQRDGKVIGAEFKVIVNLPQYQYDFLKSKRNQSRIVRDALDLYLEKLT